MKCLFYIFIIFIVTDLTAYEGNTKEDSALIYNACNTAKVYSTAANAVIPAGVTDSNVIAQMQKDKTTLITFYGDSRMDNVDLPSQGNSTMDKILNTGNSDPSKNFTLENIQNFGVAGWTTGHVGEHIGKCWSKTDSIFNLTATPSEQRTYKIGKRFVYHAGGNNMVAAAVTSYFAKMDMSKTVKGRAALPLALGWIFAVHHYFAVTDSSNIIDRLKEYAGSKNSKKDVLFVGGYKTLPAFLADVDTTGNDNIFTGLNSAFDPNANNKKPDGIHMYIDLYAYITAGLGTLNNDYRNIAADKGVHFLDVWNAMNNDSYASGDSLHPNAAGFKKWGELVGAKMREEGFDLKSVRGQYASTGNQYWDAVIELNMAKEDLVEKLGIYEDKKKELALRLEKLKAIQDQIKEAEYKMSLIEKRTEIVNSQIEETKKAISDLDIKIAEAQRLGDEQEAKRLAELKRQEEERQTALLAEQARLEAERLEQARIQADLAAQQAEAARQAEIARQQAELARIEAEKARAALLAAQQKADQAAQEERDRKLREALVLCFLFGVCHL